MNRSRIRRLLGVTTIAMLTLGVLGVGPVVAKPPTWEIQVIKLPNVVKAGNSAGYSAIVHNIGPSNINNLVLSVVPASTPDATPSYFSGLTRTPAGPIDCTTTGQLVCNLGTFTAGSIVTFTVAYLVPLGSTGTFDVGFRLRAGTGDVEGGNNSRGDKYENPVKTAINNNDNFDAGFEGLNGDQTYQTMGDLNRQNKQNSEVVVEDTVLPVTVADGTNTSPICDPEVITECANFIGESTVIDIPGHDGLIKVTMFIWGGAVPGGVSDDEIGVVHDPDSGPTYLIDTECVPATGTPDNPECLTVTKVGSNWKIVVWINDNGTLRGGF